MLSDLQLQTAERCLIGIQQIQQAVERLNNLGASISLPPIAIRFQPSPLIHGQNPYGAMVNKMMADEYQRRIVDQVHAEQERRAA